MENTSLERIRIVLVETSHPGNIGAVARAMKTMGLNRLYLVQPKLFPSAEATARAAGADDILYSALICESLAEALAECGWVVGTSARTRHVEWPELTPRECATRALAQSAQTEVALVFGRENSGLSNTELDLCHALVTIPANPRFSSLNLAAAVQVIAYEILLSAQSEAVQPGKASATADPPATAEELEGLYSHFRAALVDVGYLDPAAPKLLMRRLRRLFGRTGLDRSELNILRGILTAAQKVKRDER